MGVILPPPPCWVFLKNLETVKSVALAFCSIQSFFIRDIHAKFGIPNSPESPDVGQSSGRGISNFWISGQPLLNKNCDNSRTTNDIDMRIGLVSKLDRGNTTTSKHQFMANMEQSKSWILKAWSVILTFLLIVTFNLTKNRKQN